MVRKQSKTNGLSFRVWEGDNGDKYPMQVSRTNGGSMEFITGPNAFLHFQVMSNDETPLRNGLLELTTNRLASWTKEIHNKAGNLLLTDGRVLQVSTKALRQTIESSGVATNRLQIP